MWNQWSAGPPPLPSNPVGNSATLIGPVQPTAPTSNIPPVQALPGVQPVQTPIYPTSSGAPSYTAAQFAALTPDQQYAVQQHWQQWQAYEQQYAQWHAQYGEQYKREMAAMHGTPAPAVTSYSATVPPGSSFNFPPPTVVNTFPKQQAQNFAPPPPPPEEATNLTGVKAPPHIYEQPPPPPPPPQTEEKRNGKPESQTQFQSLPPSLGSYPSTQFMQNQDIRWSQPPPNMLMHENRPTFVDHQKMQRLTESDQKLNNNNSSETQYGIQSNDKVGRDRQKNDYRNRFQSKSSQLFEKNRHQQFDDSSRAKNHFGRNDKCNRGIFDSDRFDNHDSNTNSASSSWNKNNNSTERHNVTNLNSQTSNKTGNGSVDEKTFDEQFRLWEEQFENWKKENANHPDRTMYMQYEREFEKTRVRLLERREQMRRRKVVEKQQKQQQVQPNEKIENADKPDVQEIPPKENVVPSVTKGQKGERSELEQNEADAGDKDTFKKPTVVDHPESGGSCDNFGLENSVFKNKEITELFKSASGIPGLDLVGGKDEIRTGDHYEKAIDPEIIELDLDNDGFARKIQTTKSHLVNSSTREQNVLCSSANKRKNIPSLLDIVVEKPHLSPKNESEYQSSIIEQSPTAKCTDSLSRSISGDGDVLLSPGQRSTSSVSQGNTFLNNDTGRSNQQPDHKIVDSRGVQEQGDVPQNVSEIAKALQDPNVMQLLSVALAQAQQAGGIVQSSTQQIQLLHQLQQLQPLIQVQQERNRLPQIWNNVNPQHPPSWQNQSNAFNIKSTNNSDQNRSSLNSNPFNRNIEQMQSRGMGSGNESDSINAVQQRNPQNPFRRSVGGLGSDNNSVGNQSFGSNLDHGSFEGTFAQQPRGSSFSGGGRFDNNRPYSNIGMSLGFRNNQNNFGDRGGDDQCYRPAQVFEYQNRSRTDAIVPPTKIVDYGHRPSPVVSINSFNRDSSEFVPVKTIDYGHASSSAQVENQFSKNILYNDKKRNVEQRCKAYVPSQGNTPVIQKEKKNEYSSSTLQITSELQNNNDTQKGLNGDDKLKVIKNTNEELDQRNKTTTCETKVNNEDKDEYPKCKWILQNPETRHRPGPPTKRGKRNATQFSNQEENVSPDNRTEYDEIEENFEEISDNEELNETDNNDSKAEQVKVKIRPLFPSVSDAIPNTAMVFPSMENNNTIPIDEILFKPGRLTRPKNIVIIIRGPPGSGKSYVAKLIKDKEMEMGGPTPRLLSIDDYFMIENDYVEKCPKSGRKIPKKEILYEYEKEMEDTYMQYLIKSFKKTISDHLFDFIIVDCCNQSLRTFNEFYNAARDGHFSPFIIDMKCDIDKCLNQNIHNRNEDDIRNIIKNYQDCPGHYIKLDVSNLLENVVEMEDVSDLEDNFVADSEVNDPDEEEEGDDTNAVGFLKSKWDTDPTTQNLARLDGTSKPISKRGTATLEEYLQIDGWEPPPSSTNGKKRVRWADIEEKRAQEKMRAIGFVVGQTDWSRMMDPTSGSGALTKTKYIERLNRRR